MTPEEKAIEIIEKKLGRTKSLNLRIDKTVPQGVVVSKRICNENCIFDKKLGVACHDDNSYRGSGNAISNNEIIAIVEKLHSATSVDINVHIAGDGEPTLFETELLDLISRMRKIGYIKNIKLTTNGTRLSGGNPNLASRLKDAGLNEVNVSMHSLDRTEFKRITGIDAQEAVMKGVISAIGSGLKTSVNVLIRDETFAELDDYIALSDNLGIRIKFFHIIDQSGQNQEHFDQLLKEFEKRLDARASSAYSYIQPYYGKIFIIGNAIIDLKDSLTNNCPVVNCKARSACLEGCRYYARLSPTGILQPCGARTDNLIDLKNDAVSHEQIYKSLLSGGKILYENLAAVIE
ncbi:MAG: Radical SAM domain protein [Candidatus Micrarchaeum acidiphilum ARMAN-2]|jgi:cyclic pyranopterin phosphate synthase|uniref:Radical SAM domain protein n=1 Tax=Candidatus Micrarchaeum acidiphilum ARMAN-2 TaxID=425595 RepID=C7DH00_MICA2|nr:MAG: Radical SAM domain protein [Candidatus Micrarchaeum acidiphilum ARMAN-2]